MNSRLVCRIWFGYLCILILTWTAMATECREESKEDMEEDWSEKERKEDTEEDWSEEERKDVMEQMKFGMLAEVNPLTVVMRIPGMGNGVVYVGEEDLPADTTVALYRMLLVRKDVWQTWLHDGTLSLHLWNSFWMAYAVEFTVQDDDHAWMGLPVGDLGTPNDPTWWSYGELSSHSLQQAIQAIHLKILVDSNRIARGTAHPPTLHFFNAHLLNEPSSHHDHQNEENVSHLAGSGCPQSLQYCGTAFEAKTSKTVYPGEQLLWCYGETYRRSYSVAKTCLNDSLREHDIS